MAAICYEPKRFTPAHLEVIENANRICERYVDMGLSLTLRQLYYQFVSEGLIPNRQTEYKRLGEIVAAARMAGALDWDYLVDRTRNLVAPTSWSSPTKLVEGAAEQYQPDLWRSQRVRMEVWIEKDAGIGVIEAVCAENSVPYFSCRGYTSLSEIFEAGQRIGGYLRQGERVVVLHIGDHDPSGLDMTRDINARLRTFLASDWISDHGVPSGSIRDIIASMRESMGLADGVRPWTVRRIALNRGQIERYDPPPNPAKQTDSRFAAYQEATGLDESWELDALDPVVLQGLIQDQIDAERDEAKWAEAQQQMEEERAVLRQVARNWSAIRRQYGEDHDGE